MSSKKIKRKKEHNFKVKTSYPENPTSTFNGHMAEHLYLECKRCGLRHPKYYSECANCGVVFR